MDVPVELKEARKAKGLDRQQAAAAIGSSAPAWGNWERGIVYPSNKIIPVINKFFDLKIELKKHAARRGQSEKAKPDAPTKAPRINRGGSERIRTGDERSLNQKVMDRLPCPMAHSRLKATSRMSLLGYCKKKKKDGRGTCQRCKIWSDNEWLPAGVEVVGFGKMK